MHQFGINQGTLTYRRGIALSRSEIDYVHVVLHIGSYDTSLLPTNYRQVSHAAEARQRRRRINMRATSVVQHDQADSSSIRVGMP